MSNARFDPRRTGIFAALAAVLTLLGGPVLADAADLSFQSAGKGFFAFDTGVVKGKLQVDDSSQGIPTLVDVKTGLELAYGPGNPGVLSYYRVFSRNKRYGDAARGWPKAADLRPDGAVEVFWRPQPDHPIEMKAVYRWTSPDTLDLETVVRSETNLEDFEVFLSSYFSKSLRSFVYVNPPRHAPGKAHFVAADVNPLVVGTYLAFPRDLRAARIIYDGRWEYEPHPVQFSVTHYLAAPLAMRRDPKSDLTCLLMSRPQDCFAIETPYNMDPPDGVAAHYSMYLSLFGDSLKGGETARALTRLVVRQDIAEEQAVDLYRRFVEGTK